MTTKKAFAIVNRVSLAIVNIYSDTEPRPELYGKEWSNDVLYAHLEIPEQLDPRHVRCRPTADGSFKFVLDQEKIVDHENSKKREFLEAVRRERDARLKDSDWIVSAPDAPFTDAQKTAWILYRHWLRELPKRIDWNALTVQWPDPPA